MNYSFIPVKRRSKKNYSKKENVEALNRFKSNTMSKSKNLIHVFDITMVLEIVSEYYDMKPFEIINPENRPASEKKGLVCYICFEIMGIKSIKIAEYFGCSRSWVYKSFVNTKRLLEIDGSMKKIVRLFAK